MALLGAVRLYHRRRDKKSPAHDLLFLAVVMCLLFVGKWAEEQMDAEAMASADANRKVVAITFDDDVIIGLSQEIVTMKRFL